MRLITVLAVLITTALAAGAPARAGRAKDPTTEKARALYEVGTKHYRLGRFKEALDTYQQVYMLKPSPALLYNMAQCYRQLNQPADAARQYRAYLVESPNAPNRVEVEKFIEEEDRAAAQSSALPTDVVSPTPTEALQPPPSAPSPAREARPSKWLWPVVGTVIGVVVAGGAIALGVGLTQGSDTPPASAGGNVGALP